MNHIQRKFVKFCPLLVEITENECAQFEQSAEVEAAKSCRAFSVGFVMKCFNSFIHLHHMCIVIYSHAKIPRIIVTQEGKYQRISPSKLCGIY